MNLLKNDQVGGRRCCWRYTLPLLLLKQGHARGGMVAAASHNFLIPGKGQLLTCGKKGNHCNYHVTRPYLHRWISIMSKVEATILKTFAPRFPLFISFFFFALPANRQLHVALEAFPMSETEAKVSFSSFHSCNSKIIALDSDNAWSAGKTPLQVYGLVTVMRLVESGEKDFQHLFALAPYLKSPVTLFCSFDKCDVNA